MTKNKKITILETGPKTVFPIIKQVDISKVPITSIFFAIHHGELEKDALVYGKSLHFN